MHLDKNKLFIYFIIIIIFFLACSPEIHYKALSFFFDGVPNPNKNDSIAAIDTLQLTDSVGINKNVRKIAQSQFIIHDPYKNKGCANCHDQNFRGKLLTPQPDLCFKCHEDLNEKYSILHGPVAGGYCSSCHNPHMAKLEKLLLWSGQDLCFECHDSEAIIGGKFHADIGETNCTDCHNPHGGENRGILKVGACYKCHENLNTSYNFLHGPVASENCLSCHDSHSSNSENLLSRTGQQLCFKCHNSKIILKNEAHEGIDDMNCTECHNPHGGEDKYIFN